MVCTIYQIIGPEGKQYIGQTCQSLRRRWTQHVSAALCSKRYFASYLYAAMRKYGQTAFHIHPYAVVQSKPEADLLERQLIERFQTRDETRGYNLTEGGEG